MKTEIMQLKEFHSAFGLPQRKTPQIMPNKEFELRYRILQEEVTELRDAYEHNNLIEVADAITDCLYVLFGTALQFGLADLLEDCFNEVHLSNMSKLENRKPLLRYDGKVLKGSNYFPPKLDKFIKL